jgi:hypothetical protein
MGILTISLKYTLDNKDLLRPLNNLGFIKTIK